MHVRLRAGADRRAPSARPLLSTLALAVAAASPACQQETPPSSGTTSGDADAVIVVVSDAAAFDADASQAGDAPVDATPANGTACDDGRVCTANDRWKDGVCVGGAHICPCEPGFKECDQPKGDAINLCRAAVACQPQPLGAPTPFACLANPALHKTCDDSLDGPCRKNACAPLSGVCSMVPTEATVELCDLPEGSCRREVAAAGARSSTPIPCDDGIKCTATDLCSGGACLGSGSACACTSDADCEDDADLCNGKPYCDKVAPLWSCKVNPATLVVCSTFGDSACTQTACVPATGSCAKTPRPLGVACDDGVACSVGDACDGAGVCKSGPWTCCKSDADCKAADDGNICNGTMFCNFAAGACQLNPATVITCPTAQDTTCLAAVCQPKTGACVMAPQAQAKACDDGDACTAGEVCLGGQCAGGKDTCLCKSDADCEGQDDGNLCNGTPYCNLALGACKTNPATVVTCKTVNDTACAKAQCAPSSGTCAPVALPKGVTCDADGNACTASDACDGAGSCTAGPGVCACQQDSDCAVHEDGDLCNGTLYCDLGGATPACKVNPATLLTCPSADDGPCHANTCQPLTGACQVVYAPPNSPCEDGNPCTGDDRCNGATVCVTGDTLICGCKQTADCQVFDDGDVCNGGYVCAQDHCAFTGKALNCDDANPCTTDACDKTKGCQHAAVAGCTYCQQDSGCVDGNACTADLCIGQACAWPAAAGLCEDGNLCTGPDTCAKGACSAGKATACHDGLPCTDDGCKPASGCVYLPSSATKTVACYEGKASDLGVGVCQAGVRTCDGKGGAGPCAGQVLPSDGDGCGGGDGDCDGATDEDCTSAASLAIVCGQGQAARPGATLHEALVVQALTPAGAPVPNVKLTWSTSAGSLLVAQSTTNALGMASNKLQLASVGSNAPAVTVQVVDAPVQAIIAAQVDPQLPTMRFDYVGFCDVALLQLAGAATYAAGAVRLTDAGSSAGTVWYAQPLVKGTSFTSRAELQGDAAAASVVLQATAAGTKAPTGGEAEGATAALTPAVVVTVAATTVGGKPGPSSLTLRADGAVLATLPNWLAASDHGKPLALWLDYDANAKALQVFASAAATAKPDKPALTASLDLWGKLGASGKAIYVGVSASQAAGGNGVKDLNAWRWAYLDPACVVDGTPCDDANPCTIDSCDAKLGCVHVAEDGKPCDDGNACTNKDLCLAKVCGGTQQVACDDGNLCTQDGCDKAKGCVTLPLSIPCADGDVCNGLETCQGGACVAGKPNDCDDAIACTQDSCHVVNGCKHQPSDAACDDAKPCTIDTCLAASGCSHGAIPQGFTVACYPGPVGTKAVGICQSGVQICDGSGGAGTCQGAVVPKATDYCLNGDEDCDGSTDEDCDIVYKISALCGGGQLAAPGADAFLAHRVLVTDGSNIPLVNKKILWSSPDGGSYGAATSQTDSKGIAVNTFRVGSKDGATYTGVAAVEGSKTSLQLSNQAKANALQPVLSYGSFCDPARLQLTGVAAYESNLLRVVTGGDSQNGAAWFTTPLVKDKSFQMTVDVSGHACAYSIVLHSTSAGTGLGAGGYCDGGTKNLSPGLVLQINASKNTAANLTVLQDGASLAAKSSFFSASEATAARRIWIDYDHGGSKLSVYQAAVGAAKPVTPALTVTKNIWATLGGNGKPIYAGFTAANSSAGNNGTKYVTRWTLETF